MTTTSIKDLPILEWTVKRYHRLAEEGILEEDDKIELLAGQIIRMSPVEIQHAACVKKIRKFFGKALPDDWMIGVQDPVTLDGFSEPEPDISVLKPKADFYAATKPTAQDVLFLIEVSDTSLEKDRNVKLPLYAQAGIPEVWIVNLIDETIEQYLNPSPDGYQTAQTFTRKDTLLDLPVKDLLP